MTLAGQMGRTSLVGPTSCDTVKTQTKFSMGTLIIMSAQRLANALLTTFVSQAARIIGTKWTTDGFEAGKAIATVTILMALKRR